ncbi:MAG: hypothetical protein C4523_02835 [Myxococcales bacterium]|nr:MAG: hypothetical protein C4523_02835 [Myxococcales bacterium]
MAESSKRLHPELFTLRHFTRLFDGGEILLPTADDFKGVFRGDKEPRLLLDFYTQEMVQERLEHYGVMAKLGQKSFSHIQVRLNVVDPGRQQVTLYSENEGPENLLAEVCLHKGAFAPDADFAGALRHQRFEMLYIQWLRLQNPRAPWTPTRPALPGQLHPGLKIGREVMHILVSLAERLGLEGILNIPEFPHAAVLYSERFRFFNPEVEGILQALKRDLADLTLAEASWGVMLGCVTAADTGRPLRWFKEEQVLPLSPRWDAYFDSPAYTRVVERTYFNHAYIFDRARYAALGPLNPDGSPRPDVKLPVPAL